MTTLKIGEEVLINDGHEVEYQWQAVNSYVKRISKSEYQALSVPVQGEVSATSYKSFEEAISHFGPNAKVHA